MIREPLCQAIQDKGYSINSMASAVGIPQSSLQRFCKGKQGLEYNSLEKLCDRLGLSLYHHKENEMGSTDPRPTRPPAPPPPPLTSSQKKEEAAIHELQARTRLWDTLTACIKATADSAMRHFNREGTR